MGGQTKRWGPQEGVAQVFASLGELAVMVQGELSFLVKQTPEE